MVKLVVDLLPTDLVGHGRRDQCVADGRLLILTSFDKDHAISQGTVDTGSPVSMTASPLAGPSVWMSTRIFPLDCE
jgi:hypothetical protein